jgi:hypothetical protein
MKKIFTSIFLAAALMLAVTAHAQSIENPGAYMTAISHAHLDMNKKYMAYMSAAAHGRRARKIEKLRMQTLESITQSRYKTVGLPIYKGDNSLRQSSIDYIKLCYDVFNDDYSKIVNMEEIAEQSFDEMQAYMLLQEKTEEKIKEAFNKMSEASKTFAAKYEVKLVDGSSELSEKMEAAGKLNQYNNKVFLIFFKCNWQDGEIVKAINAKKVNDIEQGRNALIKYATEGLKALDTLKNLNGDPALKAACKDVLRFYKKMAENELPKVTDFYLKEENFNKIKKSYESKSQSQRTKEDVDAYNKAVNEINAAVNVYNQGNNNMNSMRTQVLQNWDKTQKSFSETHMPKYKA